MVSGMGSQYLVIQADIQFEADSISLTEGRVPKLRMEYLPIDAFVLL